MSEKTTTKRPVDQLFGDSRRAKNNSVIISELKERAEELCPLLSDFPQRYEWTKSYFRIILRGLSLSSKALFAVNHSIFAPDS